jgi:hypothetical protein
MKHVQPLRGGSGRRCRGVLGLRSVLLGVLVTALAEMPAARSEVMSVGNGAEVPAGVGER